VTRLWPQGQPIQAWGGGEMQTSRVVCEAPDGFDWQQQPQRILEVCNRWRIHTRWWEAQQAIWREYWKVVTDAGLLCLIYRDLESGGWFLARVYD
jgi:hypothetical protein